MTYQIKFVRDPSKIIIADTVSVFDEVYVFERLGITPVFVFSCPVANVESVELVEA